MVRNSYWNDDGFTPKNFAEYREFANEKYKQSEGKFFAYDRWKLTSTLFQLLYFA